MKERDYSHKILKSAIEELKRHGIMHLRAIALRGDPRHELVYKIKNLGPDMVVVGHKDHGLDWLLNGSVTEHLIHNLDIPVVAVNF